MDLIISDVSDEVLSGLDACAKRLGLTRGDYVRRRLVSDAQASSGPVTVRHLKRFAQRTVDLRDPDVTPNAWY